ncbi:MAG: hypothetical protein OEU94_05765 [Aquincola sp.]|nr:hypothetical protein [Aquincola sp.]MDH4290083.1 hypothetical protein [Aquincola sp.]MDH5331153.1 hypothetical protein [Aquincola sp.]
MYFAKTLPVVMPTPVLLTDVVTTIGSDAASALRPLLTLQPMSTLQPSSTMGPSTLSPSLLSDLQRFADEECETDLLPVLAASVRHAKALAMELHLGEADVMLLVFPREQTFRCSLDLCALPPEATTRLRLVRVGPVLESQSQATADAATPHVGILAKILWLLALHGARDELLPEIAGPVRYRLAPGVPLRSLPMDPWIQPLLQGLRGEPATIEELDTPTELARARARRLLNAIYLQGRLMVTRSLPMQRRPSVTRRSAR